MWKTVLFLILALIIIPIAAWYLDTPPTEEQWQLIKTLGIVYLVTALLCFVVSTITKNYSQVDKLWSVMPVIYVWIVVAHHGLEWRIVLMAILVSLWGIRLTLNFARRGGYSWKIWGGEEDYRWAILREKDEFKPGWAWTLFNLFFISLYQMGLILLMTLPIVKCMHGTPLGIADIILAAIFIGLVIIQIIADQQQWDFQTEKYRRINTGGALTLPYSKGFVDTGLWAFSRHPNYAAEQAIWVVFYLFSIPATGTWVNWSIAGAILILLLFKGSSDFSEGISAGKYPEYKDYQKRVGRFIPKPSKSGKGVPAKA